jgi:TPR repeat protein
MASTDKQAFLEAEWEQAFLKEQRKQAFLKKQRGQAFPEVEWEQAFLEVEWEQAFLEAQRELELKGKENYPDFDISLEYKYREKQNQIILSSEIEQKFCSGDLDAMNNFLRISLDNPSTEKEQQDGYDRVIDLCEKVIASRNTDAMVKFAGLLLEYPSLMGLVYMLHKEAIALFDVNAMYSLAELWLNRKAISVESEEYNRGEAICLYELAVKFDPTSAMCSKARQIKNRLSSEQEKAEDFKKKLEFAANLGDVDAMVALAELSVKNGSVGKAIELYNKAIEQNHTGAMYKWAIWRLASRFLSKADQMKMVNILEKAANLGNSDAINELAVRHEKNKDYQKSFPLYEVAVLLGHLGAMNNTLRILLDAPGTQKEKEIRLNKLRELCKKIINSDNADIMIKIASLLSKYPDRQEETFILYKKAIDLYKKSNDLNNADAMNNLADLLRKLPPITKDEKIKNDIEALKLYESAIFLGHTNAMHSFFEMLLISPGTEELNEIGMGRVMDVCEKMRIFGSAETINNLGELLEIYSSKFPAAADRFSKISFTLYKEAKELGDPVASRNLDGLEQQQRNTHRYQFFNKQETLVSDTVLIRSVSPLTC